MHRYAQLDEFFDIPLESFCHFFFMRLFDFRMCQAWRARRYCFRILRFVSKSFQVTLFRNMLHISSFTWIFMSLTWMIRDSVKSTTLWRSDLLWTPIRNGIHSYYSLLIARKIVGKFDGSYIWKDDLEILVHCQTFLSFDLFDFFFGRKCFFRPCWILSWAQISFFLRCDLMSYHYLDECSFLSYSLTVDSICFAAILTKV